MIIRETRIVIDDPNYGRIVWHSPSPKMVGSMMKLSFHEGAMEHFGLCCPIEDNTVIIDAGACIGFYTYIFDRVYNKRKVYAYEPHPVTVKYLEHNVAANNLNAVILNKGLSNNKIKVKMSCILKPNLGVSKDNFGLFSLHGEGISPVDVDVVRLDDEPIEEKIGLIKADVEGHELFLLDGARRRITEDRPLIIMEVRVDHWVRAGYTAKEMNHFFQEIGYRQVGRVMSVQQDWLWCPVEKYDTVKKEWRLVSIKTSKESTG